MNDRLRAFFAALAECEVSSPHGWCDLTEVGARVGLNETESENMALALRRQGAVEFMSDQGNQIRTAAGAARESSMTLFDQRWQHVTNQQNIVGDAYNAAGNMNFGAARTVDQLAEQLEWLQAAIGEARAAGDLDSETSADAQAQLAKAVEQAKSPQPRSSGILARMNAAKALIEGATGATGASNQLATTLTELGATVLKLFP